MHCRVFFVLMSTLLLFIGEVSAQTLASHKIRPRWIQKPPQPTNSTFVYEVDRVVASSVNAAKAASLNGMIANVGLESGVVVLSDYKTKTVDIHRWNNGKIIDEGIEHFEANSKIKGQKVNMHLKTIAEYWVRDKSGEIHLSRLYAKSLSVQEPIFDDVMLTTKYGARGFWRSMIFPGWGQFHKGSNVKGSLILGGCAVLAGGIIFTENTRSDYATKMKQTHDIHLIRSYQNKRNHYAMARNICISAAGALYLYNLIDAIAAVGAERVVVKKRKYKGDNIYSFAPIVTNSGMPGLATSINF